jgi:hypothetical protein
VGLSAESISVRFDWKRPATVADQFPTKCQNLDFHFFKSILRRVPLPVVKRLVKRRRSEHAGSCAAACKGPRSGRMYAGRGLISRHRRCRLEDRAGVADRFLAGRLCRLNASGRYGSPPGGRPDSPAGSRSRHSHSLDSRRRKTHSQKPDSRSCCSCSLDSRSPRSCNTTRRRRQQLFHKLRQWPVPQSH